MDCVKSSHQDRKFVPRPRWKLIEVLDEVVILVLGNSSLDSKFVACVWMNSSSQSWEFVPHGKVVARVGELVSIDSNSKIYAIHLQVNNQLNPTIILIVCYVDFSCHIVRRWIPRATSYIGGFLVPPRERMDSSCNLILRWIPRTTSCVKSGFLVPLRQMVDSSCHLV